MSKYSQLTPKQKTRRKYCETHRERINEMHTKWKNSNPERIRAIWRKKNKKWRLKYPEKHAEKNRKYGKDNPEKIKIYNFIHSHPELYPLGDKCIFCEVNEGVERGHLDYEDNGENYVTVCHTCNMWMEKS